MEYSILGSTMQALSISLNPGETIYTESGAMTWMSDNIQMDTNFKGGLFKSIGRALTGESLTFTYFSPKGHPGYVGFTPVAPGKIIPLQVGPGQEYVLQKDAFMVAQESVELSVFFQRKLGAGFFGGEGFIMQRLSGHGLAFAEIDGEVVEKVLAPGERIMVDTSHVAMFEASVSMDIQMMKGFKNIFFGGEGLFLTTLTGPGKVWIQTMTIANLAGKIGQYITSGHSANGGAVNAISDFFKD